MENEKVNGNSNLVIAILTIVITLLVIIVVYLLFIKDSGEKIVNNSEAGIKENNTTYKNKNADIYGTYYNSSSSGEYFKIDNDNTCTFVSTCGDTVTKVVPYKVTRSNNNVILAIDINNDKTYPDTYTGYKTNGVYRFKPNSYGCTTDENTYYITENDKIIENKNADIYGTYYNSSSSGEYFKIDNDNTCTFVSACGDTVTKVVPYKVTRSNNNVILAIDINNDKTYPDTYTGYKTNGVYRFKPNSYGCTTDENTYYIKK